MVQKKKKTIGAKDIEYAPHLGCNEKDLGDYVIFHDDIYWVEYIASFLKESKLVSQKREFFIHTGYLKDKKVSVVSTGIGAPSTAIALDELSALGIKKFFKIGTCGALANTIQRGDIILPVGAIRNEGTTKTYILDEYPAIPSYKYVKEMEKTLGDLGISPKIGIVWSTDGYHSVMSHPDIFEYWSNAGILGVEMECSAFFTVGNIRKLDVVATLVANRTYNQIKEIMKGNGKWIEEKNKVTSAMKKVVTGVTNLIQEMNLSSH
jgi:uridine phosphorylase